MIEEIRNYILGCDVLKNKTVNVDYLGTKIDSFSVNENAGYEPVMEEDILGNVKRQFQFNVDGKFHWNDESNNNIDNSELFESFRKWLNSNNARGVFPNISGIKPEVIEPITDGYIFATESDEAIYRISCRFVYWEPINGTQVLVG